jgi:hypothetical protein
VEVDLGHQLETLAAVRRGLRYPFRQMYLFHLNREPLASLQHLHRSEYSVFVNRMPKM